MNKCLYCGKDVKNKYCDVSCQNKHQNSEKANRKYGELTSFKVLCNKCGKEFEVIEREKLFPSKEKYYCSRSCANSRYFSDETKQQIGNSVIKTYFTFNKSKLKEIYCLNCNKIFKAYDEKRKFCSVKCSNLYDEKFKKAGSIGGKKSVLSQNRRSKNEIAFANLCFSYFNNVRFNEPIFNGWDADIILDDYKLAILWNGNWHHKQIGIKHSLTQVQNRDKIKVKEIINFGYEPYIINDYGKYNEDFVINEFEKLINYIKTK